MQLVGPAWVSVWGAQSHTPPAGHGEHRYFFVIHALDVDKIGVPEDATPAFLNFNFLGHILARATLTVTAEITG